MPRLTEGRDAVSLVEYTHEIRRCVAKWPDFAIQVEHKAGETTVRATCTDDGNAKELAMVGQRDFTRMMIHAILESLLRERA